jgi:hypothetical protein
VHWPLHKMSITPTSLWPVSIQGKEHYCREEHHRAMISGNSCQDKNNQPIETRVLMALGRYFVSDCMNSLGIVATDALIGQLTIGALCPTRLSVIALRIPDFFRMASAETNDYFAINIFSTALENYKLPNERRNEGHVHAHTKSGTKVLTRKSTPAKLPEVPRDKGKGPSPHEAAHPSL